MRPKTCYLQGKGRERGYYRFQVAVWPDSGNCVCELSRWDERGSSRSWEVLCRFYSNLKDLRSFEHFLGCLLDEVDPPVLSDFMPGEVVTHG